MNSSEAETTKVSVGDVALMSDAELAHFMKKHRLPSGDYDLPVDGWDKLSRDDRSRLAGRLESPTPPYDSTELETETYHKLVETGGRPLYPIDLVQDIHRQPDNYAELLRPWQDSLDQVWAEDIFQRQLQRWQDFRKWQNDNRDRKDEDDSFPAYVKREKSMIQRYCLRRSRAKRLAEIEADPSCLQSDWEDEQWERERQRRLCREHGCREFRDYVDAVKRRLASHDFTQSFDLHEDPKKQDRLTTWIEYLNYEYWWLDKHTSDIERLEPDHEKLWQELAERNILKSHETKEFVRTDASGMEREREKDQAMKAFQRAESEAKRVYMLTQEDPKRLRIPKTKRISMMKDATERLLAAKRRWEQARNQSFLIVQFVRATFGYAGAKRQAARQRILVHQREGFIKNHLHAARIQEGDEPSGSRFTIRPLHLWRYPTGE
ncbi:hypothetical protein K4K57_008860 [Colletotrichum sp. SAR 10_99]|nr:hypothetical protein K4K57_008860 [Colletotrichum sp. SAR 10_99]